MSDYSKIIASLSPEKRALLAMKLKKQGSRYNTFPLSFSQQRLWFLDQLEPGNPVYNIPSAVRLTGKLNVSALKRSINEVVRRHESLRTTFQSVNGQPIQIIAPRLNLPLPVIDLRDLPRDQIEAEVQRIAAKEARRSFDLSKGPLFVTTLLRLDEEEYVVIFSMHHIISDGWSIGVLIREVAMLYDAFSNGKPSPLPELSLQYVDFARWQQKWLQGEVMHEQLSYWKKQLGGKLDVLELPTDHPRPATPTFRGSYQTFQLSRELTKKINDLSRQEGATLFMTLLAAFQTLFYRYTGQEQIRIGSPIANRNRKETEALIGFFVNTLVLGSDFSGNPTFKQLLRRVKEITLGAYAHQDLPFEKLVEMLHPDREASYNPFFRVMFVLQNTPVKEMRLPSLTLSPIEFERKVAKFDLTLNMAEGKDGLGGFLEYSTDLFEPATIRRMLEHFKNLLHSIVADPGQRVAQLPLLSEAEQRQVVVAWNDTEQDFPQEQCIHNMFETQVERSAELTAVVYEQEKLSYRELNRRANQLAHYLQKLGVGADVPVGLYFERSVDMIVALMAILKAGGAYVPLDVFYPRDRIAFIMKDAGIKVMLTQAALATDIPSFDGRVVCLDGDWDAISAEPENNPDSVVLPQNLAYIIYTSGTTGKPKGVAITHQSVMNLNAALNKEVYASEQGSRLRVSVNGPLAFDTSVKQVVQLLNGHTLYIIPDEVRLDGDALLNYLNNKELDVFDCTPSQLQLLIESGKLNTKGFNPSHVLIGGEPIYEAMWHDLLKSKGTNFYNVYGPTECTVDATIRSVGVRSTLSKHERTRYARQILLEDWGLETQERIKNLKVFVAGAGGSGSPILTQLALIGVGHIKIVDFDVVDLSNLNRQFLHCVTEDSRIGVSKAISAKKTLLNINPNIDVEIVEAQITEDNIDELVGDANIIFDSVDDFPTKFALSKCAVRKGIPHLFYGMMDINSFGGIFYPPKAPCFHCLFDYHKVLEMKEIEQFRSDESPKKLPTPVFCAPVVASAGFMMTEALKILLGIGEPAFGKFFFFLQKGNNKISDSRGVQGIRYWMSQHFQDTLKRHNYFWEQGGWRGNYVEEFEVTPDPDCPNCAHQQHRHVSYSIPTNGAIADRPVLGRPIANTEIYIVDRNMNPVPVGVPGELLIGGVGLARGYLNRPELTAEKFVPHPFSNKPGARLYRTGDLAKYLPDGNIEFLGRVDHQVKLRGFRIELEEIEATLKKYSDISEAAVLIKEQSLTDKRLVAYIVPANEHAPDLDDLRDFLSKQLPDYMIPASFTMIDAMPLTTNGKIDRKALLKAEDSYMVGKRKFVAPRTPNEEIVANIFAKVLKIKQVSATDNFFELGGHSLLATQLISRIRDAYQVELPLRMLFESATVESLAANIEKLHQEKEGIRHVPIKPIPRDQALPLSFSQQRLWFLDQLEGSSPFYNIPAAYRIEGRLDLGILKRVLNEIIRRHESLRTTIVTENGQPRQVIAEAVPLFMPIVDLTNLSADQQENEVKRLIFEEATRAFDLSTGPLFRVKVITLGEKEFVILLTMHHIISDGWSMGVFITEVTRLYDAFSRGEASPLPELPIQYPDYAYWQRNWLKGEIYQTQLNYWRKQLDGAPPLLELPTDRPRPADQTFRGKHLSFSLPRDLSDEVKKMCNDEGITLFMMLLATFQTLLHRYSGQDDICVGTPIANRHRSDIEGLIGFFINTLVMRTKFSEDATFREMLQQVREVALGAYAHQDMPFEKLVEELQPERDLSHSPLFQVMFVFQNNPNEAIRIPDFKLEFLEVENEISQFDLSLIMFNSPNELRGGIEYNTDLFDEATIARMLEHFRNLLQHIVNNLDTRISDLQLVTPEEQTKLLVEWNATTADYPADQCIHQLFEAQVERTPDQIAVIYQDQHLSYVELNQRANQLAHLLKKHGVGADVPVGICIDRSPELIVGLLGILKAGGAYVPLDPNYPEDRLSFMIEDSNVPVLLTLQKLMGSLPLNKARVICLDRDWDTIVRQDQENPDEALTPQSMAYLIYTSGSTGRPKGVMVEHGSVVNHNLSCIDQFQLKPGDRVLQFATINFDTAVEEIFPTLLSGATLVLRSADGVLATGADLMQLVEKYGLTVLDLPTAYWHEWVYEMTLGNMAIPDSLRLVIVGGDKTSAERFATWRKMVGSDVRWLNTYGPTEGTIIATAFDPDRDDNSWQEGNEVPIGRPIANAKIYILDKQMQPVPIGVKGYLYIGGASVARGYFNRPELTAANFVPDPFSQQPGARLYHTGDLARYLPDGNIEFIGRADYQVKIRGFRIELSEIEAALEKHPLIQEAVVVAREESAADKRLVAYCVPVSDRSETELGNRRYVRIPFLSEASLDYNGNQTAHFKTEDLSEGGVRLMTISPMPEFDQSQQMQMAMKLPIEPNQIQLRSDLIWRNGERIGVAFQDMSEDDRKLIRTTIDRLLENRPLLMNELRNFLKQRLPDYMVPAAFVILDKLPRTPSNKIDRKALPEPDLVRIESEQTFIMPRNEVEQKLAEIWCQVLGIEKVSVNDNFFELGGDSILSIQVIARANQAGLQLTPKQFFENPTIAALASVAGAGTAIRAEQGLVTGSVPLTPIQRWFLQQDGPELHHYNQSVFFEVRERLELDTLKQAVEHLYRHHDILRTRFRRNDGKWEAFCAGMEAVPFSYVDLSALAETATKQEIEKSAAAIQASLNLENGPVMRVVLFDPGDGAPQRLLIVIHHLVVDAVSWRILLEDLQNAYGQINQGKEVQLPPKSTSFKYWAEKLSDYSRSAELLKELDYWASLAQPHLVPMSRDRDGGTNDVASERIVAVSLSAAETKALLQEVPSAYHTRINDILLTALAKAYYRFAGSRRLLVELEGHGREDLFDDVDISRTVGWFTTVYPVLLDLKSSRTPSDAIKLVKEQLRQIPNNGIGYGLLRYMNTEPEVFNQLRAVPKADICFNYLGQFDQLTSGSSLFGPTQESKGADHSPRTRRSHLLEINGSVTGGKLQLEWRYSENLHQRQTIERLAQYFIAELRAIIDHCKSPQAGGFTPSDFKLAKMDQKKLDKIMSKLGKNKEKVA